MQELLRLTTKLEINQGQLEERIGKSLSALNRPEAREWIKRVRGMVEELDLTRKVRYGQWPEAQEDREAAYLRQQRSAGGLFSFRLFNGETIEGHLVDFTPYTITIQAGDTGEEIVLRKLAVAYYRRFAIDSPADAEPESEKAIEERSEPVAAGVVLPSAEAGALGAEPPAGEPEDSAGQDAPSERHQPLDDAESDRAGTPRSPELDQMDEDRGI